MSNYRFIRSNLSLQSARLFMHSMIMSHITYCLTTWSQANKTSIKSIESLYKQTIKILDKKTLRYHHCTILQKHHLLSWENVIKYSNLCLIYKVLHGLSSLPLNQFVSIGDNTSANQRSSARGLCCSTPEKCIQSECLFCSSVPGVEHSPRKHQRASLLHSLQKTS